MTALTRRGALALGASAVTALAGTAALLAATGARLPAVGGTAFAQPPERSGSGGRVTITMSAAVSGARIDGRPATVWAYDGGLPGPTWRIRPGDEVRVLLRNRLQQPTNLHVHGLHVSPAGSSDNVFVSIEPGSSFQYEYRLPADHPPGVYWYHPHHHGMVAGQVFAGLYGAIIVEDPAPIPVARERVLVISDITLDATGRPAAPSAMERMLGREGRTVLVNGQVAPRMTAAPGERERWRIVNACTGRYLRLRLDGQRLQLLGIDSGRFQHTAEVREVILAPGNRADLTVTAAAGSSVLRTLPVDRGGMGAGRPNQETVTLATFEVTGAVVVARPALPAQPAPRDLRTAPIAASRTLTFAMGMGGGMGGMGGGIGGMSFTVDGRPFDPARVDTRVRAGTVEEWTLVNTSPMDHPIHLHVWAMQVMDEAGAPVWRDVVNVPARSSVRVRIPFEDFSGRTVYHCHILDHEDLGMMAAVDVA